MTDAAITVKYDVYHENNVPNGSGFATTQALIEAHFTNAELIFDDSGLNLDLVNASMPVSVLLSTKQAGQVNTLLNAVFHNNFDQAVEQFKVAATAEGSYDPTRLNIYYIDDATHAGIHLRDHDGLSHNIIIVGLGFYEDTLAHELGHAFSLGHVNFWTHDDPDDAIFPNGIQVEYCAEYGYWNNHCDFETDNLMWAAREEREKLTAGQALRVACNENSSIVVNQDHVISITAPIDCPDWSVEGSCPEVF
ncbi:MAG: hypothetical protein O7G86_05160 [Gammaproteobacteria bacterium]|nr:hypothetical protein [Gammaproteobacteria bacterium]MCZ6853292.1 hypothetical protein [Gammaproteobacteria bacterium]